jgi:hypothetical protein
MKRQRATEAIKLKIKQGRFTAVTEQTRTVWLIRINRDRVSRTEGHAADRAAAGISECLDEWVSGNTLMMCLTCWYNFNNSAPQTFVVCNDPHMGLMVDALCWRCARQSDAALLIKASETTLGAFECKPLGYYHSAPSSMN